MPPKPHRRDLAETVEAKVTRRMKARSNPHRIVWFGFGMFGLVGWSVAVPTLLGITLGIWLDHEWNGRISWTLTFLFVGVVLGCINAWYWVQREIRGNDPHDDTV
ncbi:MAG: AtpZ/AtpI family protein [Gammaproteobacteria bacterium]